MVEIVWNLKMKVFFLDQSLLDAYWLGSKLRVVVFHVLDNKFWEALSERLRC